MFVLLLLLILCIISPLCLSSSLVHTLGKTLPFIVCHPGNFSPQMGGSKSMLTCMVILWDVRDPKKSQPNLGKFQGRSPEHTPQHTNMQGFPSQNRLADDLFGYATQPNPPHHDTTVTSHDAVPQDYDTAREVLRGAISKGKCWVLLMSSRK